MLTWLKNLFGGKVKEEVTKLKTEINTSKFLKHSAYLYVDGVLAEGQGMSKEKLDQWWTDQRAKLKAWAGE